MNLKIYRKNYIAHEGIFYDENHYNEIIQIDTDAYWIDEFGKQKLLFKFRKNVIEDSLTNIATKVFKSHSKEARDNRGYASGIYSNGDIRQIVNNTSRAMKSSSNISGYFDRSYQQIQKHFKTNIVCRTTAFTKNNKDKFDSTILFFQKINDLYKLLAPIEYKCQKKEIKLIKAPVIIGDTVFSTITSNYNWRTACHRDTGDFEDGLGNLTITGDNEWSGCYIGFPEFKIAINLRKNDFLLMDVHQMHCNTEFINTGTRLSFVCYLRKNMSKCNKKIIIENETFYFKK